MLDLITEKYSEESLLKADGFDDAIIGVYDGKLVYSETKCIEILSREMGLEDASEYFYFNIANAYVGDKTPLFIEDYFI